MRIEEDKLFVKKQLNSLGTERFFDLVDLQEADNLAQNPEKTRLEHFKILREIANEILNENECTSLKTLAINGSDLIKDGHTPGKNLGIILDTILSEVIEERLPNEKDALLKRTRELKMENEQSINLSDEINNIEQVEKIEETQDAEESKEATTIKLKKKMPPKKKAIIVLAVIVLLFLILIPSFFAITKKYEKKLDNLMTERAIKYSYTELLERYNKDFVFEIDPVKIYYDENARLFETKEILAVQIRAYDQYENSYICTVYFRNAEPYLFENYVE
jgi:hypothetical protein